MKNILFFLLFLSAGATVLGQDPMQANRNDLSGRTAARDMNKTVTPPALPVYNTYVPPEITTRTAGTYSKGLYAITQVKGALKETAYQVTLLDNGQTKYEWIDESGAALATVFRTPETDSINDLAYRNMMNGVHDSTGMQNNMNAANNANTMGNQNTNVNANNNNNMQRNNANQMNNANKQMNNMNNKARAATDTMNRMNNNNMGNMDNMNRMDSTRNNNRMDSTRTMTDTTTRRDTINNNAINGAYVPNPQGNNATLNAGGTNTSNKEAKTDSSSKSSADKPKENK